MAPSSPWGVTLSGPPRAVGGPDKRHGIEVTCVSPRELHTVFASRCDRRADVRALYAEALRRELVEVLESGGCTTEDLLDAFYLRARMRRSSGAGDELARVSFANATWPAGALADLPGHHETPARLGAPLSR